MLLPAPTADFQITVPAKSQPVLVFSYVGYLSQEVPVGTENTFDISMVSDTKQLDDVVVIGYGTVQRAS